MQRMNNSLRTGRLAPAAVSLTLCGLLLGGGGQVKAETVYGLTTTNSLITFNSSTPTTIITSNPITGVASGESLSDIDFRPANGKLYALGNLGNLYTLSATGTATLVSTITTILNGTVFGIDFNPTVDRLRIVSDNGQNLRVNVDTGGAATVDTNLAYAVGDTNAAASPNVVEAAYTNNVSSATTTTLFDIDTTLNILATQNPPNNGTLNTVGLLGLDATDLSGFDISGVSGLAFASLQVKQGFSQFYTINTTTGAATLVGTIGTNQLLRGISVVAAPEPGSVAVLLVGTLALTGLVATRRRKPQTSL